MILIHSMFWYIIILLTVIISFVILKSNHIENFDNNFDIYVITLKSKDRLNNIKIQQKKIDIPIKIFDAVNGNDLSLNQFNIGNGLNENETQKKREVGCYLSHYNIYKICKKTGYTIVFEDDFLIDVDNLIDKINQSIEKLNNAKIDFDIMFLGNHHWDKNYGTLIVDNLYKVGNGEGLGGTHGYVINNKNVDKIIKETEYIDKTIDMKIQFLADQKKLNIICTYPYYVKYIDTHSTIAVD
uniref:Glycosyl transferase family 25 domain-containing protein n=1 Tax=viral metagenome TaxID=1070528 RepID=A0A6C0D3Z9_9ZZZZ